MGQETFRNKNHTVIDTHFLQFHASMRQEAGGADIILAIILLYERDTSCKFIKGFAPFLYVQNPPRNSEILPDYKHSYNLGM